MPDEDTLTLAELMLHAEQFCAEVEVLGRTMTDREDRSQLRLKISQCRGFLAMLQTLYDDGELKISNRSVRGHFRQLILALLWAAFRVRHQIDFKLFRRVVSIEAGFSYLLVSELNDAGGQR